VKGQWIGSYTGSNSGSIVINVDDLASHYEGVAYLIDSDDALPTIVAPLRTPDKANAFHLSMTRILAWDPKLHRSAPWNVIKQHYSPNVIFPNSAHVAGSWDDHSLTLSWKTDIETTGECFLEGSKSDRPSDIQSKEMNWQEFRQYVAGLEPRRLLFRGQNEPWRLRTSFHRAGRNDIERYIRDDILSLHRHLSARTKHIFNLSNADENGAFFNLIQHHGYPTPLLDWTYSPYVAAFFAYRGLANEAKKTRENKRVRIVVFNQAGWRERMSQVSYFATPGLHVSIGEFIAIGNERMIPQQAASTVTNIDDVESYVQSKDTGNLPFLSAIDLPLNERKQVIRELSYMGITAGSLFPGLDGACEELKERNFEFPS
jgi:hypothetical protein